MPVSYNTGEDPGVLERGVVGYGAMPPGKLSGFYPLQRNLTISRLAEVNQLRIKQFYHIIFMKS